MCCIIELYIISIRVTEISPFILKQLGIKTPSLASVKRFKFSDMELPQIVSLHCYKVKLLPAPFLFSILIPVEHHFIQFR